MTWLVLAAALAQSPPSVEEHLQSQEVYTISDGSSVFRFHRDHRFELEPVGMSGRRVDGVWTRVDGGLLVTGQWSWLNGASLRNDYREMLVSVSPHPGEPTTVGFRKEEVQPAYFVIDRLQKVNEAV